MPPRTQSIVISVLIRVFQLVAAIVVLSIDSALLAENMLYPEFITAIVMGSLTFVYVCLCLVTNTKVSKVLGRPGVAFFVELLQLFVWLVIAVFGGLAGEYTCEIYKKIAFLNSQDSPNYTFNPDMDTGSLSYDQVSQFLNTNNSDQYCQLFWTQTGLAAVSTVLFAISTVLVGHFAFRPVVKRRGFRNSFKPLDYYTGQIFLKPFEAPEEMADFGYRYAFDTEKRAPQVIDVDTVSSSESTRERITSF
ncbi:hypothetical protein DICA1_C14026 [Diutina catenulata]